MTLDPDLILILGLLLAALAIPASVSAMSDLRMPRVPMAFFTLGACLCGLAMWMNPSGYAIAEIPDVFFQVIGRYAP